MKANRRPRLRPTAVVAAATNRHQWITLYQDGRVRLHVEPTFGSDHRYRTLVYRPKLKSDRAAIRRLIEHFNLTSAGYDGEACQVCNVFE